MKKIFLLFCTLFSLAFTDFYVLKQEDLKLLFQRFVEQYRAGDFVNAEKSLLIFLESKEPLTKDQLSAVYNNLGATYTFLGRYDDALDYYNKAENLAISNSPDKLSLGDIYVNKAIIFGYQKSFYLSVEFFEKAIRLYSDVMNRDKNVLYRLSTVYLNAGIIYYRVNNYKTSLEYLERSLKIKQDYNLPEIGLVYLNIAKTYMSLNISGEAEKFFLESIKSAEKEFGADYFRLPEVFFGYGSFLQSVGRTSEALDVYQEALLICLRNYGEKHSLVSQAYKNIGDNYMLKSDYKTALVYYQKSLTSVVKDFNDTDIFTNPAIDSSLFDIRLLDNLKSKSQALELIALQQDDMEAKLKTMGKSLETIELALKLIDIVRNNYMSEESRIYLAENEKETYLFAIQLAGSLFTLTHNDSLVYRIYGIAQLAKTAVLRNEIIGNDLLNSSLIPDSLREMQNRLSVNISAYNRLILEESRKPDTDSAKISFWKDALFDMNREKEKIYSQIEIILPQYHDLIRKTDPVSPYFIQRQLKKDETIIDYLVSNRYSDGRRKLYIFLISHNNLFFRQSELDTVFRKNSLILRNTTAPALSSSGKKDDFISYTGALNYMYLNLISPIEDILAGNKLIIIPDEEIGWLPFDALLKDKPLSGQTDFEGLHFLINDYTFSYGYSSSMVFNKSRSVKRAAEVIEFSPGYSGKDFSDISSDTLRGAGIEIGSINKLFRGRNFNGEEATKTNFIKAISSSSIFHLAMHSMSDSSDSRYSYLMFDNKNLTDEDAKLYNYEISLTRISSPMIVLSACNSGSGTLYSGEGLMSLARGFILAGASSVIKTAWEINDEASAEIMTRFYSHLAQGYKKNDAMRHAKLEYLKEVSPAFTNPYYWAAYEVLGDNAPIVRNRFVIFFLVIGLTVILIAGGLLIYFRRRSIFSDRSR